MNKPNFLFLFPDQHRGDWMPYDDSVFEILKMEKLPINMPNIKKLMQDGTSFYRCITSSPLCAPARACLASGRRYRDCRVPDNDYNYPIDMGTFYSILRDCGYTVGGVGKFDLRKKSLFWGLDGWVDDLGKIGFTAAIDSEGKWDGVNAGKKETYGPYLKYLHEKGLAGEYLNDMMKRQGYKNIYYTDPTNLPEEAYGDTWVGTNGVKMLRRFPVGKPWFLQVNFPGPHDPWDVTSEMRARWKGVKFPKAERSSTSNADGVNAVRQNYAAMLENIDIQAGLLIDEIKKRGELSNTIIVYSSDHGEMLGDLGLFYKQRPNRGSVSIPLVIWGDGIIQNISGALVELQDLAATFLEFACIAYQYNDSFSLKSILTGKASIHRESVQSALGNWTAVYDRQYKMIYVNGHEQERYDYINDPWERENLD